MRTIGLLLWAWMPVAPFVVVGSWWDGVGVVWGLLLLAGGASLWVTRREEARAPGWLVGCLGGLWALCITYSLALAGSRLGRPA